MDNYKVYKLTYYKLEETFLREYILRVDRDEILSTDIYLALMNYPKYSNKNDILSKKISNDRAFFKIIHGFGKVKESKLNEYKERYDIINLESILLPNSFGQSENFYSIEYDELIYLNLWTLITGILNYVGDVEKIDYTKNYDLYISKLNNINQMIYKLLKQLKDNPDPIIKEYYNRIEYSFQFRLIKEINLNNELEVEEFLMNNNQFSKKDINIKKKILKQSQNN